jgi:hypothetical protein
VTYLLELLDGTLVNTSALVDQVCMPLSAAVTPHYSKGHLLFTAYIVSGLLMVVGQAGDDLPHVGGCVCVFCGSEVKFCFSAAVLAGCRATS